MSVQVMPSFIFCNHLIELNMVSGAEKKDSNSIVK